MRKGQCTLNGVDFGCLDGGPLFTFKESISFVCRDQGEIDRYWPSSRTSPSQNNAAGARIVSGSVRRSFRPT
ncbi:MAG TPA: VOC family protein [Mycetocola sp.]|nr:VOC family protein [Mycetocola sp.]